MESLTDRQQADLYIQQKVSIEIYHTDEFGHEWLWAIQVAGTDFWLGGYRDRGRAIKECEENGLPIERVGEPFKGI